MEFTTRGRLRRQGNLSINPLKVFGVSNLWDLTKYVDVDTMVKSVEWHPHEGAKFCAPTDFVAQNHKWIMALLMEQPQKTLSEARVFFCGSLQAALTMFACMEFTTRGRLRRQGNLSVKPLNGFGVSNLWDLTKYVDVDTMVKSVEWHPHVGAKYCALTMLWRR